MMHFSLFCVFLLCYACHVVIGDSVEEPTCEGANEVYGDDPYMETCQTTCANLNKVCIQSVLGFQGCSCELGYYRDSRGVCVYHSDPDCIADKCGENEINANSSTTCISCEKTCRVRIGTCKVECQSGCYCKPEYYRNANNLCVLAEKCDTPNETDARRKLRQKPNPPTTAAPTTDHMTGAKINGSVSFDLKVIMK